MKKIKIILKKNQFFFFYIVVDVIVFVDMVSIIKAANVLVQNRGCSNTLSVEKRPTCLKGSGGRLGLEIMVFW